jgi:hypothetical protein
MGVISFKSRAESGGDWSSRVCGESWRRIKVFNCSLIEVRTCASELSTVILTPRYLDAHADGGICSGCCSGRGGIEVAILDDFFNTRYFFGSLQSFSVSLKV